jgi:hypothetical protein
VDADQDPFGRALRTIRRRLRSGRHVQGERLLITDLARELRLSATPIREALSRLAGEDLLEDRRGAGYFAWRLDAVDLTDLYGLQGAYLSCALGGSNWGSPGGDRPWQSAETQETDGADDPHVARTEAVLRAAVSQGRNLWLVRVHQRLADRLAPARSAEPLVLDGLAAELRQLEAALADPVRETLTAAFENYCLRRKRAAPALVAAMRSRPPITI